MSLPQALTHHAEVCDEIYELMLAENRILKANGRGLEDSFLNRKRAMLLSLTTSLESVRNHARLRDSITPELRGAMEKVQQIILKTLLLDRENEQLLLKTALHPVAAPALRAAPAAAAQVQRIYRQF
jgi:hypothetical protein